MTQSKATIEREQKSSRKPVTIHQGLSITTRLAKGRLGAVYVAVHEVLARRFAVKVLNSDVTARRQVGDRLRRNIRDASQVEHPHVVALTDFGKLQDSRFFLTMEFVRGTSLRKALESQGRLPMRRAVVVLMQLADAIEAGHRLRIVHGDIKPSNIILMDQIGDQDHVRLADFAICRSLCDNKRNPSTSDLLDAYGDLAYLAPEQTRGGFDGRADIYGFGAVAYHVITGRPPFIGEPEKVRHAHQVQEPVPPSRRSGTEEVPSELEQLILRCLEKSPDSRQRSMEEAKYVLYNLMSAAQIVMGSFEEEITGRWQAEDESEEDDEPLPASPAKVRKLWHDLLFQLARETAEKKIGTESIWTITDELGAARAEASQLAVRTELMENRFEDIRRELRERESALRYAIIDLNLAKEDVESVPSGNGEREAIEHQIVQLEHSLSELERQRRRRFTALNSELQQCRDRRKALELRMESFYRQLYAAMLECRSQLQTKEARRIFRRLAQCRQRIAAISHQDDSHANHA